ncbi:MAG TPA: hypothetical protein VGQ84_12640 [Gaiellaceae bacterium]|nr:hypothetical protein [Gaiellaceae bacterium]
MPLADDFRASLRTLPDDWPEARFTLIFEDEQRAARAASLLGVINAVRRRNEVLFSTTRHGPGSSPETVARALRRVDRERLGGELKLVSTASADAEPVSESRARRSLAADWNAEIEKVPPDWTDLYAELELASTDYLDGAALRLAPLNPSRVDTRPAFRFRAARSFGYGASPQMVRRCLERLDEAGITGDLRILYVLSDTKPVATQGPVWYVGGKVV